MGRRLRRYRPNNLRRSLLGCGLLQCLLLLAFCTGNAAASTCPCKVCPCYCPCVDLTVARIAFVHHAEFVSIQLENTQSYTGFQLSSGAEQAARERGLHLAYYHPFKPEATVRLLLDILSPDTPIHGIVATLYSDMYTEAFLEASSRGIPLIIVGSTSASLLGPLRQSALLAAASQGVPDADPRSLVRHVGVTEETLAREVAARLLSLGMRRAFCIYTNKENVGFQRRCEGLERMFAGTNCTAITRLYHRTVSALQLAAADIANELAAATVPDAVTALVVMDVQVHFFVTEATRSLGILTNAHMVVFESSIELLQGARAGQPLTIVDQPFYSEGYAAVALAAYQLQTGEVLTSDVAPSPQLLYKGQVSDEDVAREVCRQDGYPVCGDPGVADVSPGGCACFNRTNVRLRVLATLPTILEIHADIQAGLRDGARDFPGSSFQWDQNPANTISAIFAAADTYAATTATNWSSVLSLDHFYVPSDPRVHAALVTLGRARGGRPFWLGMDTDNTVPPQDFLDSYGADGYIGPTARGSAAMGSYAARVTPPTNEEVMVYTGILYAGMWAQATRAFIDGFFNGSLAFPDNFWRFPVQGDPYNCSGVFGRFHDGWAPGERAFCPQMTGFRLVLRTLEPLTVLQVVPSPPALAEPSAYVEQLRAAFQPAPGVTPARIHTLALLPVLPSDLPGALALLQGLGARGNAVNATRVLSLHCTSSDWQALAYPDSMVGGQHFLGCVDLQLQLATYITYMGAVLARQARGERLFYGSIATERLLTRDGISGAAARRRADCLLHRARSLLETGEDLSFSVCGYAPACGANASAPCSGRGECQFPNASINTSSLVEMDPATGWCVCQPGFKGGRCEHRAQSGHELLKWLLLGGGLLLLLASAAATVSYLGCSRAVYAAREHKKALEAKRRRPPSLSEHITVVLTDIEGSTRLWEWDPLVMDRSLQIHHKVLRDLLGKHYGYECDTEGDAFEVVFHDASDALRWALETQLALLEPEKMLSARQSYRQLCPDRWPDELLLHPSGEEVLANDGAVLFRGLRVRMGIHTGMADTAYLHENGRRRYGGKVMDMAKAIVDAASQGGQVLMSMDAWAALGPASLLSSLQLVVHNLGEHLVDAELPPMQLMEVLPQALLKRSPFKPIKSIQQLAPSFFDAPAAHSYVFDKPPTERVIIMFTFVEVSPTLKRKPNYGAGVAMVASYVRQMLGLHSGYECEEKNGNFLLAFANPLNAVLFSQDLQVGAMALPWPEELLANCNGMPEGMLASAPVLTRHHDEFRSGQEVEADPNVYFRGLRIKCGFYWDLPTRCLPHASTGRASYFGPLMNRAARIACHAADGQTLCSDDIVAAVAKSAEVTRRKLTFMPLGPCALKGISMPITLFQVSSPLTRGRVFKSTAPLTTHPLPLSPDNRDQPHPLADTCSIVWRPEHAAHLLGGGELDADPCSDATVLRESHSRDGSVRSWVSVDIVSQPLRRLYQGRRATT